MGGEWGGVGSVWRAGGGGASGADRRERMRGESGSRASPPPLAPDASRRPPFSGGTPGARARHAPAKAWHGAWPPAPACGWPVSGRQWTGEETAAPPPTPPPHFSARSPSRFVFVLFLSLPVPRPARDPPPASPCATCGPGWRSLGARAYQACVCACLSRGGRPFDSRRRSAERRKKKSVERSAGCGGRRGAASERAHAPRLLHFCTWAAGGAAPNHAHPHASQRSRAPRLGVVRASSSCTPARAGRARKHPHAGAHPCGRRLRGRRRAFFFCVLTPAATRLAARARPHARTLLPAVTHVLARRPRHRVRH